MPDDSTEKTNVSTRKTKIYGPGLFDKPAELQGLGGSVSDVWNNEIANQTLNTLTELTVEQGAASNQTKAMVVGLWGIHPNDEIEGMLAAQLIAGHNAVMECYRLAAAPNLSPELRQGHLSQAGKLSRSFTMLLDSLNRHRGKGQQKVTVEHVHVHKGGQAIVGNIEAPGGRVRQELEEQPHARQIENAPQPAVRGKHSERIALPIASHEKRPLPATRRSVTRRTKGK